MRNFYIIIATSLIYFGCKPKVDKEVTFDAGTADFSKTVYIGDNLLSGYTNSGLYLKGQENSIAQIISTQLQQVGGDEVTQPLMSENGTGYLKIDAYTNGEFTVVTNEGNAENGKTSMLNYTCGSDSVKSILQSNTGNYSNISCPGLKVNDINTLGFGNANENGYNPYFDRINTSDETYTTVAANTNPSFFIVAFGLSDVLSFVENGASCGSSTEKKVFETNFNLLIESLSAKTNQGVLCEIPNIEKLSYLNVNYAFDGDIYIEAKQQNNTGNVIRKYEVGDQFLRKCIEKIGVNGYGLSDTLPIKDIDIIDRIEKDDIAGDIFNYNLIINAAGSKYNLPVVQMSNYLLAEDGLLGDSLVLNGTNTKIDYELGSAISLDGIFPTPKGAAAIANKFIIAINDFYEANIPLADINQYPGLQLD